ncbi:BRCA1-A complex subunit RAP80 isoform X2 [Hyperolius riggenbachi]|uniref:BRCA1-A complex subunit RAP80 isoform X2 n=1 Tax=Hyperolius riggenbachi TaxID=752182 RepID=UPI0035A33223
MLNRRKRKRHQGDAGKLHVSEEDAGPSSSIVISDSDSLELQEEHFSRSKRPNHRKTLATKRKIARMTEEEQLALAVKMSQQEQANQNDDLETAIEESLHSCNRPVDSTAVIVHDLTAELSSDEEEVVFKEQEQQHFSQQSQSSNQGSPQNPKVLLTRLSQDVLQSSSVAVSPNYRDSSPRTESHKVGKQNSVACMSLDLTAELSPGKEDISLKEQSEEQHFSQKTPSSSQVPKVLLTRLSQDIVESSSIILSPNFRDPFPSCKSPSLSQSNSHDFATTSPLKTPLSPVFPVRSPFAHGLLPCRLFPDKSISDVKLSGEVGDHCSGYSQRSQVENELSIEESSSHSKGLCGKKPNARNAIVDNKDVVPESSSEGSACASATEQHNDNSVHYYWGIPFCPKGLDPSTYTKVIMCQLEVYEKSLKKVQRQLLHKAKYGQPIQLCASSASSIKDSQEKYSQGDIEEIIENGDQQNLQQSPRQHAEETDSSDTQPLSGKRSEVPNSLSQRSQEDVHSCPSEEENANHLSGGLFANRLPEECEGAVPVVVEESSNSPANVNEENCPEEHIEDIQEEENTNSLEPQDCSEQMDKPDLADPALGSSQNCCPNVPSSEEIAFLEPVYPSQVECPMCSCTFSQDQIEQHAAYCDGAKEEPETVVLRPRKKLSRQTHDGSGDKGTISDSGKCEMCYVCKSLVLLGDYEVHVDRCLQEASSETRSTRRAKCAKEPSGREGRLLSMLEQSEAVSAALQEKSMLITSLQSSCPLVTPLSDHLSLSQKPKIAW